MTKTNGMLRKARVIITVTVIVLLHFIPIKVKTAIEIVTSDELTNIDTLIGEQVTVLCKCNLQQVSEPDETQFNVLAAADDSGVFKQVYGGLDTGITVYPLNFIGNSVMRYNMGRMNKFVFRGNIRVSDETARGDSEWHPLRLDLYSWDIVYPVNHIDLNLFPDTEFYLRNIFLFDYLWTFSLY